MAKIKEGEEVLVLRTGELGIVRQLLTSYTAMVDINGEYREEAIASLEPSWIFEQSQQRNMLAENQTVINKDENKSDMPGLYLLFEKLTDKEDGHQGFSLILLNLLNYDIRVHYQFSLDSTVMNSIRKPVPKGGELALHSFTTDQLNYFPVFNIEVWNIETQNDLSNSFKEELKLKPKQFFSDKYLFGNDGSRRFLLAESFQPKKEKNPIPISKKEKDADDFIWVEKKQVGVDPLKKATMPNFIDLHIEKLDEAWELLDKNEILQIQLDAFQEYMEAAIQHGLHKVYIVHGLGKGVLRNAISKELDGYKEVVDYNNQYHPKFGNGATEVILE